MPQMSTNFFRVFLGGPNPLSKGIAPPRIKSSPPVRRCRWSATLTDWSVLALPSEHPATAMLILNVKLNQRLGGIAFVLQKDIDNPVSLCQVPCNNTEKKFPKRVDHYSILAHRQLYGGGFNF